MYAELAEMAQRANEFFKALHIYDPDRAVRSSLSHIVLGAFCAWLVAVWMTTEKSIVPSTAAEALPREKGFIGTLAHGLNAFAVWLYNVLIGKRACNVFALRAAIWSGVIAAFLDVDHLSLLSSNTPHDIVVKFVSGHDQITGRVGHVWAGIVASIVCVLILTRIRSLRAKKVDESAMRHLIFTLCIAVGILSHVVEDYWPWYF